MPHTGGSTPRARRRPVALVRALVVATLAATAASPLLVTPAAAAASGPVTIDDFAAAQSLSTAAPDTVAGSVAADAALGGVRRVTLTAGGTGSASVATGILDGVGDLTLASDPTATGVATITYDGTTSGPVTPTGLGAVDLTEGGTATAVALPAAASVAGVTARLRLWSSATACSVTSAAVPADSRPGVGSEAVAWRFADLATDTASGCTAPADATQVGAVEIDLDTTAAPGATVVVRTVAPAALDWGDLPAAYAATTAAEGGAAAVVTPGLSLGSRLGGEPDGTESADSSADADDDGVSLAKGVTWSAGSPTDAVAHGGALDVVTTGTGCLAVWADLAGDASFADAGDQLAGGVAVTTGTQTLRFALPATFALPASVVVRARLFPRDLDGTCTSPEAVTGVAAAGEVEDYVFSVTGPPAAPVIVDPRPQSPSASRAPTWNFTLPAGATGSCEVVDGSQTVVLSPVPCSGAFTPTLPATDGNYSVVITATDAEDRSSPPVEDTYTLDTRAPNPPAVVSAPSGPSNAATVAWGFTLPAGTTANCQLTYAAGATVQVVFDWTACTSPRPVFMNGRPDGTYTFSVEAVDAAGNISSVVSSSFVRDATPPGPPVITGSPKSPSSSAAPSWTFTVDADSSPQCQLSGPSGVVAPFANCSSPFVGSLAGQADGPYTLTVRAVDAAGNVSASSTSVYGYDATAPTATILRSPASPISSSTLSFQVASGEPSAQLTCRLVLGTTVIGGDFSSCSGTKTYDVSDEPDGTYVFQLVATDLAGNVSPVTQASVTVDRTKPAVPTITPPSSPTHDPATVWTVTGDGQSVLYCTLSGYVFDASGNPTAETDATTPCAATPAYDLSHRPDGDYTLTVYALDQAGNQSASAKATITLSRKAPGLALTGRPPSLGRDRSPTWSFTTDPGATAECRLDYGTDTNIFPFARCTSPITTSLDGLADGTYTFSVRSTDAAGNVAGPIQATYTLLTTPPAAPTVLTSPQSPGNVRSPAWTFAPPAGTTTTCRLVAGNAAGGGGTPVTSWAPCTGTYTADLTGQPNGVFTFQVEATDAAGNVSAPADAIYELDTVAANPRVVTAPTSPGKSQQVTWTFALDADESAYCRLSRPSTGALGSWVACASPVTEDLRALSDGEVDLQLQAKDRAGNVSGIATSPYVLDTTPPAAPVFTSTEVSPGASRSPSWQFRGPTDGVVTCRTTNAGVALTSWQACPGDTVTADLTGLADGDFAVQARATDAAGNVSGVATSSTYQLLTTAPPAPVITSTPGAGGAATSVAWTVLPPTGTVADCRLQDGSLILSNWAPCSSTPSYDLAGAPDGTLLFSARAVNQVATPGQTPPTGATAVSAFVLDRTPPAAPVIAGDPTRNGAVGVAVWNFTAEPGAATSCEVTRQSDGQVITPWGQCTGTFAVDLTSHGNGTYVFSVRAADTWGNTSTVSTAAYSYAALVIPPTDLKDNPTNPATVPTSGAANPGLAKLLQPYNVDQLGNAGTHTTAPVKTVPTSIMPTGPPATAVASKPVQHPDSGGGTFGSVAQSVGHAVGTVLAETRDHAALPLVLIVLVLLFLAVQDRLDRGDPKLTLSAGSGSTEFAEFR